MDSAREDRVCFEAEYMLAGGGDVREVDFSEKAEVVLADISGGTLCPASLRQIGRRFHTDEGKPCRMHRHRRMLFL